MFYSEKLFLEAGFRRRFLSPHRESQHCLDENCVSVKQESEVRSVRGERESGGERRGGLPMEGNQSQQRGGGRGQGSPLSVASSRERWPHRMTAGNSSKQDLAVPPRFTAAFVPLMRAWKPSISEKERRGEGAEGGKEEERKGKKSWITSPPNTPVDGKRMKRKEVTPTGIYRLYEKATYLCFLNYLCLFCRNKTHTNKNP